MFFEFIEDFNLIRRRETFDIGGECSFKNKTKHIIIIFYLMNE